MNKTNELFLESQVVTRVGEWCERLNWEFKRWGWYIEVCHSPEDCLVVGWDIIDGVPSICLSLPAARQDCQPRLPPDILLFLLRRNVDTAHMHWCITRHFGLAVTSIRPLDAMTFESFRDTVGKFVAERQMMLRLAREEIKPEPQVEPPAADSSVATVCPGCGAEMKTPASTLGKQARCPRCGAAMVLGVEAGA